jgi:hypothetical protein
MKELRDDRHTVSLLTDHLVINPKCRGMILRQEFQHLNLDFGTFSHYEPKLTS